MNTILITANKNPLFKHNSRVWQAVQAYNAKNAITTKERANKTLDTKQLLNKWAQQGNTLSFRTLKFTFTMGNGYLLDTETKRGIWGATISDFFKAVADKYGIIFALNNAQ